MPNSFHNTGIDLRRVITRNDAARHVVAGLAGALPSLVGHWRIISAALADTTALITALSRTRLDHANLLASARAALTAHDDGEDDPLSYLRDELQEQGQ